MSVCLSVPGQDQTIRLPYTGLDTKLEAIQEIRDVKKFKLFI